ncbi:HNH endonuclease [Paenibacillus elgii]|nr:HNH endonuclease [Paenibacillus elgii]
MTLRPLKPCSRAGCPELTRERYCTKHKQEVGQQYERRRGSAHARGYDNRWRKYRLQYLAEHPLCVECKKQNRLTAANVVDHIEPHKGDYFLFWNPKNHQGLCDSCHSTKTAREDGGFGNG